MLNERPQVLLLDYWSDHNRGDAAMQIGIARLVRDTCPSARITVMTAFGFNQADEAAEQLDETQHLVDHVVGGVRPTYVPFTGRDRFTNDGIRKRRNALALACWPLILLSVLASARLPLLTRFWPRAAQESLEAVRQADLVIWNGRNFRSDSGWREPYEIAQLLFNPFVARIFRRPMASVGLSMWPIQRATSRRMLRRAFRWCFFVSAREEGSFRRVKDLLGSESEGRLHLLPDLSLAAIDTTLSPTQVNSQVRPRRIALTVVDWPNLGEDRRSNYVSALKDFIRTFLDCEPTATITIIPQVTYEMESTEELHHTLMETHSRVLIDTNPRSVSDLVSIYSTFDLLVATRMHSAIFATCSMVPTVIIPYDAGGKWEILNMLGQRNITVPFADISADGLLEKINEVWADREAMRVRIAAQLPAVRADVARNVTEPMHLLGLARSS